MISPTRRQFMASVAALAGGALVYLPAKRADASALPDLIVTSAIIPPDLTTGQLVRFGATITNQGLGATPAGIEIGIAFDIDGQEVTWSGTDRSSLAAGASINLFATSGPTGSAIWTATAGSHVLTVIANDGGRLVESSTANDRLKVPFTVSDPTTKPVNIEAPTITGIPNVGNLLTASSGTWS